MITSRSTTNLSTGTDALPLGQWRAISYPRRVVESAETASEASAVETFYALCESPRDVLARVQRELGHRNEDRATQVVLVAVERWLHSRMHTEVDQFLQAVDVEKVPAGLLLGALALTRSDAAHVPARASFLQRAETALTRRYDASTVEGWLRTRR